MIPSLGRSRDGSADQRLHPEPRLCRGRRRGDGRPHQDRRTAQTAKLLGRTLQARRLQRRADEDGRRHLQALRYLLQRLR